MIKDKLSLYCVYHKKQLKNKYVHTKNWFESYYKPLVKSKWFIPYFTRNNHINSLDKLQDLFCEVTAIYYIYKNNLYNNYIGICHYDRQQLRYVIENDICKSENIKLIGHMNDIWNYYECMKVRFVNFLYDDIKEYITENYNENDRIYKYFITNEHKSVRWLDCMNFITINKYFSELAEFITGFIDWHMVKHNINYNKKLLLKYINDNFLSKKDMEHLPDDEWWLKGQTHRMYGYVIEMLVGFYFGNLANELNDNEVFKLL